MDNLQEEKIKKTVLFEKDLHDKIIEMSKNGGRDFSKQVKFMLREYIKVTDKKNPPEIIPRRALYISCYFC